jgi:hypothetical protein
MMQRRIRRFQIIERYDKIDSTSLTHHGVERHIKIGMNDKLKEYKIQAMATH